VANGPNIFQMLLVTESDVGKSQVVRFHLQQQVVHRHVHHPLSQQEGPLRREDQEVAAHSLLPGIHRHSTFDFVTSLSPFRINKFVHKG